MVIKNKFLLLVVASFFALELCSSSQTLNDEYEVRELNYQDDQEIKDVERLLEDNIKYELEWFRVDTLFNLMKEKNADGLICVCKIRETEKVCGVLFGSFYKNNYEYLPDVCKGSDGRIVGLCNHIAVFKGHPDISKDRRRQCVAMLMMQYFQDACLQRSIKKIFVMYLHWFHPPLDNDPQYLFKKFGFSEFWKAKYHRIIYGSPWWIAYKNIA